MNMITSFFGKYFSIICTILLVLILLRSCNNDSKILAKRIDSLNSEMDSVQLELNSLKKIIVTNKDLRIEGLRSEKRMIQSTDRKMLDVKRQADIDKEIETLQK